MAGLSTGQPNSDSYNLGRGALYFADIDATTGLPGAYRHLGNAPAFSITVDSETLEHQSSLEGLKTVDKEVVISQSMTTSLTLDEINFDNLSIFLSGTSSSPANVKTTTASDLYDPGTGNFVPIQRWYDILDSTGVRMYDIETSTDVTLAGSTAATFTEGTDYTLDRTMGRVYLITLGGTPLVAGEKLQVTVTGNAGSTATINQVSGLSQTTVAGALKFVGKNPANADDQVEYQFHKISLKAEGEFNLISDDWTQMQFTGKAEKNTGTADSVSNKTLTVTSYAVAEQTDVP